ncbi:MAG TPA: alcohol dehydrogenase, partial [Solirubrobacteraceae bacterium]|nr:alcohol dehydrogenase [Solirubrobacteraceae bacterium]
RHIRVAELLSGRSLPDADEDTLPSLLLGLMGDLGVATSLGELGYGDGDIDALVEGALKQQRLLAVAPLEVGADDLAAVLRASL